MTCIVGIAVDGEVWIGGDSSSVDADGAIGTVKQRKVFRNGSCLIGCAGEWSRINALYYDLDVPEAPLLAEEADWYVQRDLVPAAKAAFEVAGLDASECDPFLVGVCGRLFLIDTDWHVEEPIAKMAAIGSGAQVGIGAVAASRLVPRSRILRALRIAAEYAPGVRAPFYVERI